MNDERAADGLSMAELRARLADAEETLRAIRDGEADALVVRSADEDAVFSLSGGDEAYRAIMEAMDVGAVALDEAGHVLYANAAFCTLVGCGPAALNKCDLFGALSGESARIVRDTIKRAREGRHQTQFLESHKGHDRHLMITAAPLRLAFGTGSALTFADVTERVEAAAAEESARMARAVIASANEAVVVCDRNGTIVNANAAAAAIAGSDPVGQSLIGAFALTFAAECLIADSAALVAAACGGEEVRGIEAEAPFAVRPRDLLVSAAPLRLAGEAIGGCVITLVDLTERKSFEKQQTMLMHELDHRVKNTLTMVLSISGRTLAGSSSLEDFRERFTSRVQALAATHNLLAEESWAGLELGDLIRTELAPYLTGAGPLLEMRAIDRMVAPDVAIAFGLVIHELATNAVKYGALSTETGRVAITGRTLSDGTFEITWIESGGPPVSEPTHTGFGQTLITRSLARGGGTGAFVTFAPGGLVCRMVLPAS